MLHLDKLLALHCVIPEDLLAQRPLLSFLPFNQDCHQLHCVRQGLGKALLGPASVIVQIEYVGKNEACQMPPIHISVQARIEKAPLCHELLLYDHCVPQEGDHSNTPFLLKHLTHKKVYRSKSNV